MTIENGNFLHPARAEGWFSSVETLIESGINNLCVRADNGIEFIGGRLAEVRLGIGSLVDAAGFRYLEAAGWFNDFNIALEVNKAARWFFVGPGRNAMRLTAGCLCIAALFGGPAINTANAMNLDTVPYSPETTMRNSEMGYSGVPVVLMDGGGGGGLWDSFIEGFTNQNNAKMVSEEERMRSEKRDKIILEVLEVVAGGTIIVGLYRGANKLWKRIKKPRKR